MNSVPIEDLLEEQEVHDQEHHSDIHTMTHPDRLNHYVLHFSKYAGRLSSSRQSEEEFRKTIADSFIVCLAMINTLEMDDVTEPIASKLNKRDFGVRMQFDGEREWLFRYMAANGGAMANALESLDHLERNFDFRSTLEDALIDQTARTICVCDEFDYDLEHLVRTRWEVIESEGEK